MSSVSAAPGHTCVVKYTHTHTPRPLTSDTFTDPLICFQIIFYEDRNFQGRSYECSNECSELHSHFTRCNSIRVDSGDWVVYEKPNFSGYQYVLKKGEYPHYQHWMGFNDCVRSCRMIPKVRSHTAHEPTPPPA